MIWYRTNRTPGAVEFTRFQAIHFSKSGLDFFQKTMCFNVNYGRFIEIDPFFWWWKVPQRTTRQADSWEQQFSEFSQQKFDHDHGPLELNEKAKSQLKHFSNDAWRDIESWTFSCGYSKSWCPTCQVPNTKKLLCAGLKGAFLFVFKNENALLYDRCMQILTSCLFPAYLRAGLVYYQLLVEWGREPMHTYIRIIIWICIYT